ncbi:MAG: hypothetical protein ABIH76_03910, partial [Candidatus Bathyarchaeota archaeon]
RFARFGLTIHPKKSKLLNFSRPSNKGGKGPSTFDFLGFTHYWGKTRRGGYCIKRKTRRKKLLSAMKRVWIWCKENRHITITEQHQMLSVKLRGHYQYYGIRSNYKMLEVFYEYVQRTWKKWLGRRSRNGYITWEKLEEKYLKVFPLPTPRIVHRL